MKIVVNNGLYSFIQQCYQSETKSEQRSESKKGRISYAYNLMHHFSPVIPKVRMKYFSNIVYLLKYNNFFFKYYTSSNCCKQR